jgi:hypothetical protein
MPVQTNLAASDRIYAQQDVNAFQKQDVYFVLTAADELPNHVVWSTVTGSQKWTPNMGSLMRTVTPEPSPVSEQQPNPNNITEASKKNVYSQRERTEDARVKKHRFESEQIHFLGEFQDVRRNQLDPLTRDITRQIAVYNDHFIREAAFQRAPYIYVCGYQGNSTLGQSALVPSPNTKENSNIPQPKTAAFLTDIAGYCKGIPSLEEIDRVRITLKNDLGAIPFSGAKSSMPLKNDLLKGTYNLVIGDESWNNLKWSDNANWLKSTDTDFIFKSFRGRLFGDIDTQCERFPLRMTAAGAFPAPQITDDDGNTRPNPDYINAPFEFGWVMGDDFGASIEIGPPTPAYAGKATETSAKLDWNGKPTLTSNFLIKHADGTYETNSYGEFRKIQSQLVMGYVPRRALSMVPFLYKRARVGKDV